LSISSSVVSRLGSSLVPVSAPMASALVLALVASALVASVGVLGPTAHPGLPLKVFLGVGRCRQL
jgi:hypothetical protein